MLNMMISDLLYKLADKVKGNYNFHVDVNMQKEVAVELKEIAELL